MKLQSRKLLSFLLMLSLALSTTTFSMPSKAAVVTTVYDFNGTDFSTSLQTTNVGPDITVVSDTSVIPTGFTGSVMSATHSTYVSAGVDFFRFF